MAAVAVRYLGTNPASFLITKPPKGFLEPCATARRLPNTSSNTSFMSLWRLRPGICDDRPHEQHDQRQWYSHVHYFSDHGRLHDLARWCGPARELVAA